ncbi:PqqD family protein [uncultured Bacteroides sp.]|uniref:PqqD family protein n=1 Tax=uncultured Bacteroides sp. TaxID=162156 RepID=UPI002AA75C35|nr:PqqD family protein [uncultured Bacteroides sp.]
MERVKEKINLLEVIPVHNEHITTKLKGDCITIAFPRFKAKWVNNLFRPLGLSSCIHLCLEEHGSSVWTLIDGKRTVGDIIGLLAAHFNFEENYESRVLLYLNKLHKDGFIKYYNKL